MKTPSNKFQSSKIAQTMLATGIVAVAVAATTPFDDKAEAANVQLNTLKAGSVISFAGYEWIVLNPSTGYILMKNDLENITFSDVLKYDVTDSTNIAYYLNNFFYNSLPVERELIMEHSWTIGPDMDESRSSVSAKVGLISMSEWMAYSEAWRPSIGFLKNPPNNTQFWTRTKFLDDDYISLSLVDGYGALISYGISGISGRVLPALYLTPSKLVSEPDINGVYTINIEAPTVTTETAQNITSNSATISGNITTDGNALISERGIIYSTIEGSLDNGTNIKVDGTTGIFSANLSGLTEKTTYQYQAYAKNAKGTSYGSIHTFTTATANRKPTVTAILLSDQTTNRGINKTVDVSSYFSDVDGDTLTYTASSNETDVATVDVSGENVTITPVSLGTSTITVTANDGKGGTVSQSFTVTVANQMPTATPIPVQTTNKGTNNTVNLLNYFSDADGDALTYTAISSQSSVAIVAISENILTITPVSQGNATVTVTAYDGKGSSASQSFTVTVANRKPTVTTIPDQTTNKGIDQAVDVSSYFSDADKDVLTYTASSSHDEVATAHVSGDTVTIKPVSLGTSTITITANDGNKGEVTQTFTVTVANRPPVAKTLPNQTMNKGSNPAVVNLSTYFSDEDKDALTYTTSSSSDVATVHVSGDTVTITPVSQGTENVTVMANDRKGGTVSESFKVTIENRKPTASIIPNQTMNRGSKQTVNLSTYFSDVDDDSLTYSAVSSNDVATVQVTGDTLTITSAVQGNDTLTVTANDGKGGTITESFTVTFVIPIPAAPNVTANDTTNKIQGATNTMEYSTDNGTTWTNYDVSNEPTFTGNKTVWVRVKAQGDIPPGDQARVSFTTNPSSDEGYSDGSTPSPTPTPDPTPVLDPAPIVQAPEYVQTIVKDGKLQIQIKDEKTGEWKPARIEHTQSIGGFFIIQTGNQGEGIDLQGIDLPQGKNKIVVLDNDQPYTYFDMGMETVPTKEWKVKFSEALLNEATNFGNFIVQDAAGNKIEIKVTLSEDGQTVVITPDQLYKKGELYYLTITDTIGENGKKQKKPIRKIFIIE